MDSFAQPAVSPQRTAFAMRARLAAMIFLQYWTLGAWAVTVWTYLAENTGDAGEALFTPRAIGYCLAAGAIGSLVSPAVFGWIADRFYAAERLLAGLHLAAALTLFVMSRVTDEWAFVAAFLAYFHLYVPTVSLTNTVALRHLRSVEREFPPIRVFGTYAWITAGCFVGLLWPLATGSNIEPTATPLVIGSVAGVLMAVYSLTLPHTPPETAALDFGDTSQRRGLWRNTPFVALLFVSIFACAPSQAYNLADAYLNERGYQYAATKLTLGQVSEIACMLLMPSLLLRFGPRRLFLLGVIAWCVRFVLFAFGGPAAVYFAIAIHGPSYAFVYVAGQLYVDRLVPKTQRGAAQGWHTVASSGLGHLLGAFAVSQAQVAFLTPPGVDPAPYRWFEFWLTPAAISFVALVLTLALLRTPPGAKRAEYHATDAPPSPADALTEPPHA